MAKKHADGSMSISDLLSALTQAQKERDSTMDELRRIADGERKRAETAERKVEILEKELEETAKKTEGIYLRCQELEKLRGTEKENYERLLEQKDEDFDRKMKQVKEKLDRLQTAFQEIENTKMAVSDELMQAKSKLRKVTAAEENLQDEIKQLKDELSTTKDELNKTRKTNEITDSELHVAKMQLLKENNINNRLLDELKRTRKDIDEYKDEIVKLKKSKEQHQSNLSKQIKDLSVLVSEKNNDKVDDDLREIRSGLSVILKENFLISTKINDVFKFLMKGDTEVVNAATQTSIGLDQMFSYENMDREVTSLVMRLREELLNNKSDLVELRQENQMLQCMVREMKREKERLESIEEEESRVEKLEDAVRSLKQMLHEEERVDKNEKDFLGTLNKMRNDLEQLKEHVSHKNKHEGSSDHSFGVSLRPIKLIQTRKL